MPNNEEEVACIGGPSKALEAMTNMAAISQIMAMFTKIVESPESYSTRIDNFPRKAAQEMLPYKVIKMDGDLTMNMIQAVEDDIAVDIKEENIETEVMSEMNSDLIECTCCASILSANVDTDLKKFLDLDEIGFKVEYRCPVC